MSQASRAWRAAAPGRRRLLPVHQPVTGDAFMPAGWCGGCDTCSKYPAPIICEACSFTSEGHPRVPVDWDACLVAPRSPQWWATAKHQHRLDLG